VANVEEHLPHMIGDLQAKVDKKRRL
jgi:hypothetical protein